MPPSGGLEAFCAPWGDKIVVKVFPLEWSCLLLLLVLLGTSTGAFVIVGGLLALPSFTAEEGADRLFSYRVVGHHIHQLVDGLRVIPA